jgi:hypothetical protein
MQYTSFVTAKRNAMSIPYHDGGIGVENHSGGSGGHLLQVPVEADEGGGHLGNCDGLSWLQVTLERTNWSGGNGSNGSRCGVRI